MVAAMLVAFWAGPACGQQSGSRPLADLSLEELANVTITSVSRREQRLSDAAASVYVITAEDIRRSGATTLPEALRLAPNLQVARFSSGDYAISARGFNAVVANKLLVLIDGRTVYTPLFSGVFWDQQNVMLEDVERIEVRSGPGGTLWGTNAVNGVINVITRPAGDTQGSLLSAGLGDIEQGAAFRHGGALGDAGHFRVYAKAARFENTKTSTGIPVADGRDFAQAGFRADLDVSGGRLTIQGDAYDGKAEDRGTVFGIFELGRVAVEGMNVLARWSQRFGDGSDIRLQAYVDHANRKDAFLFQPESDIFDVEFQHGIPFDRHRILWGAGYRHARDDVDQGLLIGFDPAQKELDWSNVFVQDEIALSRSVQLTLGIRLERNDYTGTEHLPSARLAWKPSADRLVWAAASRAVRAPSRFDREVFLFVPPAVGPNFKSEVANVVELGYRAQAGSRLTYSATLFHHEWDHLRSGTTAPLMLENRIQGPVYGAEGWATWQAASNWRLSGGLTVLRKHLHLESGSTDPSGIGNETLGSDPEYQWMLRSSLDLGGRQELDAIVRHVARLRSNAQTPAYTALDLRYGWHASRELELSAVAQNLLDGGHPEFLTSQNGAFIEIERAVFFKARWSY